MVRSMMSLVDLPISFWGYALLTAAHVLNRTPCKAFDKTPYELCTGKVPKFLSMTRRYQSCPGNDHWITVNNILKYLNRTKDKFFVFGGESELFVKGYTDANFQTDYDDFRS